jgi:hypothetical protein
MDAVIPFETPGMRDLAKLCVMSNQSNQAALAEFQTTFMSSLQSLAGQLGDRMVQVHDKVESIQERLDKVEGNTNPLVGTLTLHDDLCWIIAFIVYYAELPREHELKGGRIVCVTTIDNVKYAVWSTNMLFEVFYEHFPAKCLSATMIESALKHLGGVEKHNKCPTRLFLAVPPNKKETGYDTWRIPNSTLSDVCEIMSTCEAFKNYRFTSEHSNPDNVKRTWHRTRRYRNLARWTTAEADHVAALFVKKPRKRRVRKIVERPMSPVKRTRVESPLSPLEPIPSPPMSPVTRARDE